MARWELCPPTVAVVLGGLVGAACGDDEPAAGTLPPIVTTTTTTTTLVTTTTVQQFYEVQRGDTLFKIAERFGTTMDALIAVNNITDPDRIEAGQRLEIPPPTVVVSLPDASTSTSSTFVAVSDPPADTSEAAAP